MPTIGNIHAYAACVLETEAASPSGAFGTLMNTGGDQNCSPYFNWANSGDNSSNPGESGSVGVATESTVVGYMTGVVPFFSSNDLFEVDSDYGDAEAQSTATTFTHYSKLLNQIPVGGWYGMDQNTTQVLVLDHYYNNQTAWSALGLVCRPWGVDNYESLADVPLSNYKIIFGVPSTQDATYAADMVLVESWVSSGGTLIVYNNGGAPSSLTGIGTTATALPLTHPIYQPYAQADLIAGGHDGNDYINAYGKGQVITLHAYGYGDGFNAGNENTADALASGLGFLTLNAITWLAGQPWAIALPKYVQRTSWAAPLNSNGEGGFSGVGILAVGYPLQCILLSNQDTAATPVGFVLNPTFYGISSSVTFTDANTGATSGPDFTPTIPAQDWMVFLPSGAPSPVPTTLTLTAEAL
jgi:hypothetical protein